MKEFKKFIKGIRLKDNDTTGIGDLSSSVGASDNGALYMYQNRVKAVLSGSEIEIATISQAQTLTNKTIDADNNTISNIEVDNLKAGVLDTDLSSVSASDDTIPSAKAVKTYVDDSIALKDQASEISYDNATSGLTATDVQAAIDEVEGRLDTVETTAGDAATDLSNHVAASSVHGVSGDVVGTTDSQTLTNKTIQGALIETPSRSDVKQDTEANLTTYATTASNGQLVFATDTKKIFQVLDGALSEIAAGAAADISYDNSTSGLTATDTQAAIDEVEGRVDTAETDITNHTSATSGVHGVTGDVVGTTDSQILTGKTIDGDNNTISNLAHGAEVDNPTSGVHGVTGNVVGDSDTQTLTNKTVSGGTVSGASIETPTRLDVKQDTKANLDTYAGSAANGQLVFATDIKKMFQVIDNTLVDVGGGGTGLNFMPNNGDAETGVADLATYDDGAVDVPVDGTDGSPSVIAVSQETSSPLRDSASFKIAKSAANGQGEGASIDFDIDTADQNKIVQISFDYTTTANYSDDLIQCFIFDKTNSKLIRTNLEELKAHTGQAKHTMWFQASPDSTSYRLILHVTSTETTAWDVVIDRLIAEPASCASNAYEVYEYWSSPSGLSSGSGASDMTWTVQQHTTNNAFNGSVFTVPVTGWYNVQGMMQYTPGTTFNIYYYKGGSIQYRVGRCYNDPIVHFHHSEYFVKGEQISYRHFGGGTLTQVSASLADSWIAFALIKPASDTCSSNSGKDVYVEGVGNNGASLSSGNAINWTKVKDNVGGWSGSVFTAPEKATYLFVGAAYFSAVYSNYINTEVDGSFRENAIIGVGSRTVNIAYQIELEANQTLEFTVNVAATLTNDSTTHFLTISKVGANSNIVAPQDKVRVKYRGNNNQSLTASVTDITFDTEDYDTHNAWTGTVFNCPKTSYYNLTGVCRFNAAFGNNIEMYVDGNQVENIGIGQSVENCPFSGRLFLNKGEQLSLRVGANATLQDLGVDVLHHIAIHED
jgi:hypothetical protein